MPTIECATCGESLETHVANDDARRFAARVRVWSESHQRRCAGALARIRPPTEPPHQGLRVTMR